METDASLDLTLVRQYSTDIHRATRRASESRAQTSKRRVSLKAEDITYFVEQLQAEFQFEAFIPLEQMLGTLPAIMNFVEQRVKTGGDKRQAAEQIFVQVVQGCLGKASGWADLVQSLEDVAPVVMDTLIALEKGEKTLQPKEQVFDAIHDTWIASSAAEFQDYFQSDCIDSNCVRGIIAVLKNVNQVYGQKDVDSHRWALDMIRAAMTESNALVLSFANGTIPLLQAAAEKGRMLGGRLDKKLESESIDPRSPATDVRKPRRHRGCTMM